MTPLMTPQMTPLMTSDGCCRRPQGLLAKKRTNLEMVLNTEDEYPLLIASAVRWRLAEEMRKRR